MGRIGIRELRQHASRYLSRVKAGETFEVTDRGRLVAILSPPAPGATGRERLTAAGLLQPATRPFAVPPLGNPVPGARRTEAVLDELREERLP